MCAHISDDFCGKYVSWIGICSSLFCEWGEVGKSSWIKLIAGWKHKSYVFTSSAICWYVYMDSSYGNACVVYVIYYTELIPLMMEAVSTSETSVSFSQTTRATSQKTVIFILCAYFFCLSWDDSEWKDSKNACGNSTPVRLHLSNLVKFEAPPTINNTIIATLCLHC
jgi:hypothetical protein